MQSVFPVVCTNRREASRDFYVRLFGFQVAFDSDFYTLLQAPEAPAVQLAFVDRTHHSVPPAFQHEARGVFVTIEVESADALHARVRQLGIPVVYPLTDEDWGQRHFMVADPSGLPVDVVQTIPMAPEFARRYGIPT